MKSGGTDTNLVGSRDVSESMYSSSAVIVKGRAERHKAKINNQADSAGRSC